MNDDAALRRAAVLARFGRLQEAIDSLEVALRSRPDSQGIKLEVELLKLRLEREALPNSSKHQVVGWILFVGSVFLSLTPIVIIARSLRSTLSQLPTEAWPAVLYVLALIGVTTLLLYLGVHLFLRGWFKYLRRLPIEERNFAEGKLAHAMNLYRFEPMYSRVRDAKLEEADA